MLPFYKSVGMSFKQKKLATFIPLAKNCIHVQEKKSLLFLLSYYANFFLGILSTFLMLFTQAWLLPF